MKTQKTIAFIIGTGLWRNLKFLPLESRKECKYVKSIFGNRKTKIYYYEIECYNNLKVIIIPRHGNNNVDGVKNSPASLIQQYVHEDHIWLLYTLGVTEIYAFNCVGALDYSVPLGDSGCFIIPNDMSYGFGVPVHSFGKKAIFPHPEMYEPFSENIREKIKNAINLSDSNLIYSGVYVYTNPDHLETNAEGDALRRLFANKKYVLVGSTLGAELVLSKEMGLKYAAVCVVANYVQGDSFKKVTHTEVEVVMESACKVLTKVMKNILIINSY